MDMRQIKIPEELYHCFEAAGYRQHYEANEDIYMQEMMRDVFTLSGKVVYVPIM